MQPTRAEPRQRSKSPRTQQRANIKVSRLFAFASGEPFLPVAPSFQINQLHAGHYAMVSSLVHSCVTERNAAYTGRISPNPADLGPRHFLLLFSAQKSHVKPRNHLTLYHPTISVWHVSYIQTAILDIYRSKKGPGIRHTLGLTRLEIIF